jgi:hypothetical protein
MALTLVDVYCADEWMWNGLSNGRFGTQVMPGPPPTCSRTRNSVPFIGFNQDWSTTIDKILKDLNRGDCIRRFFLMGHGSDGSGGANGQGGQFTVGETVRWDSDDAINEFCRLSPFTSEAITYVHLLSCQAAADGACVQGKAHFAGQGLVDVCVGVFSGSTGGHGYQLLRKLAAAIDAPVSGSTINLPIGLGWDQWFPAKLTVGPDGSWAYRAFNAKAVRFGSP